MFRRRDKAIRGILTCAVLLFSMASMSSCAAGTVDNIVSDTTDRTLFSVGEKYCFLITPKDKDAEIDYTVGNGKVLETFVAGKPTKNADGTTTYVLGFMCIGKGETGIYITANNQTSKIFTAYVGDTIQEIISKIEASDYTISVSSEEMQLLVMKGGEEGRDTLNRIMEHANPVPGEGTDDQEHMGDEVPVPGESTPGSVNVEPPSQNYSYQKDLTTAQEVQIDE